MNYRSPKYAKRIEDLSYELETPLVANVANNASQTKTGYRFVVNNSNEASPYDWYNARFLISFKVNKLADGGALAIDDHNGVVNGIHSLIHSIIVKINGIQVYDNDNANQTVNIKNLLEYDRSYSKTTASNTFYYLDTSRSDEEREAQATYNKGFHTRKTLLGLSATVTYELPLNRYSFFEALESQFLPNSKVEIQCTLESDANVIWQAADNCRFIVEQFQLWVPKIEFNGVGQKMYMENYLKPHSWTYFREMVERSPSTRQQTGTFQITSGISRPRHVFVWFLNDARIDSQTQNMFLFDTFNVANNRTLTECYLDVASGIKHPEVAYTPSTDYPRQYRDVLKYIHGNNDYKGGSLLSRTNYEQLFPFIYFDLTKQKSDIKDGATKLVFRYKLSGVTNADYSVYGMVLYEQDVELIQSGNKLLLRS